MGSRNSKLNAFAFTLLIRIRALFTLLNLLDELTLRQGKAFTRIPARWTIQRRKSFSFNILSFPIAIAKLTRFTADCILNSKGDQERVLNRP